MPQAELIFGIVGAIGTPIQFFINILEEELRRREYEPETIRLSKLMDAVALSTPAPQNVSEYERLIALIQRGDELRQRGGDDVLAKLALSQINAKRPAQPPSTLDSKAFIIRQLKHPEEVYLLRNVYRDAFHVIGLYSPKLDRQTTLIRHHGMSREQADELMQLDEHENVEFGQRFRDTFHLADVFISQPESGHDTSAAQLTRFFDLLFGARIITPTKDEYGMFLAYAGALRSSSLSRQVGASLLRDGDVLALGTNEVPRFGGGSYWEKDLLQPPPVSGSDGRDHVRKVDSSDEMKREVV
ncbi:MAG TPA: hypothetical protein VN754_12660, partial [Candidatus Binataceae bacterium]|nr:hypothetical protein [Candidatus Binataceae bacterium]